MSELTRERLREVVRSCLFDQSEIPPDGSDPPGTVIVEGVVSKFGFHAERLKAAKPKIVAMLAELPREFFDTESGGGGGWSLINLPFRADGSQWGEQLDGDELFCLASGVGLASFCAPREFWSALPGGVPYVVFRREQ